MSWLPIACSTGVAGPKVRCTAAARRTADDSAAAPLIRPSATPVLHAIGNHDTWPYYSLASTWREWERGWTAELGREYLERQFPGRSLAEWRGGGYYSRRLGASLRLVVLNTNQLALTDGTAQLDWLEAELVAARRARQRVLLLGHIPPGPSHYELDSICAAGHFYQRAGAAPARAAPILPPLVPTAARSVHLLHQAHCTRLKPELDPAQTNKLNGQ